MQWFLSMIEYSGSVMEIKFSSDFTYTGEVNMPFPQNKTINTTAENVWTISDSAEWD